MIRGWLAAGTLAAVVLGGCQRYEHDDDGDEDGERFARPEPDSRVRHAGTHRAGPAELATRNRVAAAESAKLAAKHVAEKPSVPATSWVSLGPTDAPQQFNYYKIDAVDSGRPNTILVDPRDANVVYVATSGGGVWKTYNFLSGNPAWVAASDTLPNLAVGALALDPAHPETLYLGNGDFIDGSGNTMFKTTNGGGTWSAPIVLGGTYASSVPAVVGSIRQIQVDGDNVWVATDAGLFHSGDAGASYALVDLPEATGVVAESVWSIVPLGQGGWLASGVTACDVGAPPPGAFGLSDPDPMYCPLGTDATLWRTVDGTTWTQVTVLPRTVGTNRTTLAVGPTPGPTSTVVYAFVGDLYGYTTLGYWRSNDGGQTWTELGGTLANPTFDDSCTDLDVGHDQTWYNQAIVVDPTDADHVLVGGNLCGVRTLNGTSSAPRWENVSHWLPGPDYGVTAGGRLAYVHADWHTATSVVIDGVVQTFTGSDGGVFSSTNLFTAQQPEQVVWTHHNKGLATHLFYSVASGDPATGDPFTLFGGLQDNGTRFRATTASPSAFNQPIGGDGIGGTVHHGQEGTTLWASVEYGWLYCRPSQTDCSVEQPEAQDDASSHWHGMPSPVGLEPEEIQRRALERMKRFGEDSEPFYVHYANVETDHTGQSVLTHTDEQVFVSVPSGDGFTWQSISQDLTPSSNGAGIANVTASRATPDLYGAAGLVSAEPFYITTHGNTRVDWIATRPVTVNGTRLTGASSIDFPPAYEAGELPGQVFIGAFTGTLNNADRTPPPDNLGRLWKTTDGGQTWHSIVGSDPAHQLPNVPIYVVKYDPIEATTIYAGTDLGVYITLDGGATWDRMGDGLPMVPVRDIYVAQNQDFIRVATYGRGLWEIYPSAGASHGAPGNGDYDHNLQLDWIDLGAMAARQGVTPEQTTPPFYSWILDMTGTEMPVQAIDANDLAAFISKFGGHP
jgi:photosystem II stability/assembly factor-like uncharacterized protein